jgi:hypothetical protein
MPDLYFIYFFQLAIYATLLVQVPSVFETTLRNNSDPESQHYLPPPKSVSLFEYPIPQTEAVPEPATAPK